MGGTQPNNTYSVSLQPLGLIQKKVPYAPCVSPNVFPNLALDQHQTSIICSQ